MIFFVFYINPKVQLIIVLSDSDKKIKNFLIFLMEILTKGLFIQNQKFKDLSLLFKVQESFFIFIFFND